MEIPLAGDRLAPLGSPISHQGDRGAACSPAVTEIISPHGRQIDRALVGDGGWRVGHGVASDAWA